MPRWRSVDGWCTCVTTAPHAPVTLAPLGENKIWTQKSTFFIGGKGGVLHASIIHLYTHVCVCECECMWVSEWPISLSRIFFPREGQTVFEKVKFNFFSAFSGPSGITFRVFCATAKRPASSRATPDCRSGPVTLFSYTCFERQTWTHSCEQNSTKFKNDSTLSISFVIECIFLTMIKHWFFQGIQTANRSGRVWTAATALANIINNCHNKNNSSSSNSSYNAIPETKMYHRAWNFGASVNLKNK